MSVEEPKSADAWLFICSQPGRTFVFSSIEPSGSELWPWDEWTTIKRVALVADGEPEIIWKSKPL